MCILWLLAALAPVAAADTPPVRIVPHLSWTMNGVKDPTGRLVVCPPGYRERSIVVVDVARRRPAWILPVPASIASLSGFAFSPDGRTLAMCGPQGGLLLDVERDRIDRPPWLRGEILAYSPDGAHLWVASGGGAGRLGGDRDVPAGLLCFTPRGVQVRVLPLSMNLPGRITFQNDGKDLIVEGAHGVDLEMHVGGRIHPVTQMVSLDTGRITTVRGEGRRGFGDGGVSSQRLPDAPPAPKGMLRWMRGGGDLMWEGASRRFIVSDGGALKVWAPLGETSFARTISLKGTSLVPLALGRGGVLYCTAWYDTRDLPDALKGRVARPNREIVQLLALVDPAAGTVTPLPLRTEHSILAFHPMGMHVAILVGNPLGGPSTTVEIWNLERFDPPTTINVPGKRVNTIAWIDRPMQLAVHVETEKGERLLHVYALGGQHRQELPVSGWAVVDPTGRFAAFGAYAGKKGTGYVSLLELATGQEFRRFPGNENGYTPFAQFVSPDEVIIADSIVQEVEVAFWGIGGKKPAWTAPARGAVETISRPADAALVVVNYKNHGADILRLSDGGRLPITVRDDRDPAWRRPTPILGGRLVLDAAYEDSNLLNLVEAESGQTIATFAPFADPDWMIWTPEGLWTGTDGALDWISFYRGRDALSREEALALRKPEVVRERIEGALNRAKPRLAAMTAATEGAGGS